MQRLAYIPLLVITLLSFIIFIVIKVREPNCPGMRFAVPATGQVDANIAFADSSDVKGISRVWDFGDSTTTATDSAPSHRYARPGKYIVALTINNSCRDVKQIEIVPKPVLQIQLAQIQGPTGDVYVGDQISMNEMTPDATEWEWAFGESGKVDAKTRQVSYVYRTAGSKKVTVYVTTPSGKISGTYSVDVKNKDAGLKPQMLTAKDMAGAIKPTGAAKKRLFETKLSAFLAQKEIGARNKLYSEMRELVCSPKVQVLWVTPILKRNKKMSFDEFCVEVMNEKDTYNVSEQTVSFDDAKDCISDIRLKMKSK